MARKPEVFLLSDDRSVNAYQQRAQQLKASGCIDKGSVERLDLYQAQKGKKVVLIDDDPDYLSSSASLLSLIGAEVHAFSDPLEALKQITTIKPDTILSDINMPHANGLTVLQTVNEMEFD